MRWTSTLLCLPGELGVDVYRFMTAGLQSLSVNCTSVYTTSRTLLLYSDLVCCVSLAPFFSNLMDPVVTMLSKIAMSKLRWESHVVTILCCQLQMLRLISKC